LEPRSLQRQRFEVLGTAPRGQGTQVFRLGPNPLRRILDGTRFVERGANTARCAIDTMPLCEIERAR
jgi:hypothetical protein